MKTRRPSFTYRLLLLLLDGETHVMGDSWEWLTSAISPAIAARSFHRRAAKKSVYVGGNGDDLDAVVTEGYASIVKSNLHQLSKDGIVQVAWPDPVSRDGNNSHRYIDPRGAVVQLGPKFWDRLFGIFNNSQAWARLTSELRTNLEAGRIRVSVRPMG